MILNYHIFSYRAIWIDAAVPENQDFFFFFFFFLAYAIFFLNYFITALFLGAFIIAYVELPQLLDAILFLTSTHNICFYRELDKNTGTVI